MLMDVLVRAWEALSFFGNTIFGAALISAFIGSLAGAWGGAYAAQKIAERPRRRTLLLDEIRGCNAGIDAVGAVLNAFLNLKGQHLVLLKKHFDDQVGAIEVHRLGREGGWIDEGHKLELRVDQGSLPVMRVPVERLQAVMTEKVTLSGRPQGLMNMTAQSVHFANEMIEARNDLIVEIMGHPRAQQVPRLFGLPMEGIGEDGRHRDCISGIWKYANDVIYYSSELARVLTKHGRKIEGRYRTRFGALPYRTSEILLDTAEYLKLKPEVRDYASWEATYVLLVPATEGRGAHKCWYAVRNRVRRMLRKPWGRKKKRRSYVSKL